MRIAWLLVGLLACKKDDDGTQTGDTDTGTPPEDTDTTPPPPPGPDLVITDENNYTLSTSWTIGTTNVIEKFDVIVDWNALTVDAWGVSPFPVLDTDKLVLMQVLADVDELPARIAADDLGNDLLDTWEAVSDNEAFLNVSDLRPQGDPTGTPFDPADFLFPSDSVSWLSALVVMNGEQYDIRQALILVPVLPGEGGSAQASFTDTSSSATWSAAIDGVPLVTAEGHDQYTLNWQGLVNDALGRRYDEARINHLFIASFDEDPATLASNLFELEELATGWWTMDIANEDEGLPEIARDADGATFPGFTAGPTWLIGASCTTVDCFTRFPAWLVEVDVVAQ
jgi:hypothetical protein